MNDPVAHWERVYRGGGAHSWDQPEPSVSLWLLEEAGVRPEASVIDVGGGDGALAAGLLARGFGDVTVLDISEQGLAGGRRRVGAASERVTWIVADLRTWRPPRTYDCWHDRAVFHFFVDPADRGAYGRGLRDATAAGALAVVGTFAADGPQRCSGLPVARYDADELGARLSEASGVDWRLVGAARETHSTPSGVLQPFTWVVLRRTE